MDAETLVRDYMGRLETASTSLPIERRGDLLAELREHIELALAEAGSSDEATVRNVLQRLGSPDEIVAAELGRPEHSAPAVTPIAEVPPTEPGRAAATRPRATVETKAILLLTLGAVLLPFVGPLLGLGYLWSSARWTTVQKHTATISVVGLLMLPAAILFPMAAQGELTAIFSTFGPLLILIPMAGFLTAGYLLAVLYVELSLVLRRDL
jgi:hypothetical protein